MSNFELATTRASYPKHAYEAIKNAVLGKKYAVTLAFVGPQQAAKLNATYRKKDYTPNVLSFPLLVNRGEIYICLSVAKKEWKKFSMSYEAYVGYLFLHGLLHLKGLDHGEAMDKEEARFKKRFLRA